MFECGLFTWIALDDCPADAMCAWIYAEYFHTLILRGTRRKGKLLTGAMAVAVLGGAELECGVAESCFCECEVTLLTFVS